MTPPNSFAWLTSLAAAYCQREQATTKRPYLILITPNSTIPKARKPNMKTTDHQAPSGVPLIPLHKHGAFSEISAAIDFLSDAAECLVRVAPALKEAA